MDMDTVDPAQPNQKKNMWIDPFEIVRIQHMQMMSVCCEDCEDICIYICDDLRFHNVCLPPPHVIRVTTRTTKDTDGH